MMPELKWLFRGLALLTLGIHTGFLLFLFLGGVLFEIWPGALWLHLSALIYAISISLLALPCPLTALQKWLDRRAGRTPYSGDCVAHYLWSRLPVTGDEGWLLAILLIVAVAINIDFYLSRFAG